LLLLLLVKHFGISIAVQLEHKIPHAVIHADAHRLVLDAHLAKQLIVAVGDLGETDQSSRKRGCLNASARQAVHGGREAVIDVKTILGGQLGDEVGFGLGEVHVKYYDLFFLNVKHLDKKKRGSPPREPLTP